MAPIGWLAQHFRGGIVKSFSFVFVTFGASLAMAYPAINDKAEYQAKYSGAAGGSIDYTQRLEITAFDASKNEFTVKSVQEMNGASQAADQQLTADQIPTEQQVRELLAQCAASGGTPEQVTVPAGTFESCSMPEANNGRAWIAAVPFGFVKLIAIDSDGNRNELQLVKFELGN